MTSEKIYNFKKNKIKRQIPIYKLSGISKNLAGAKNEFTLHVLSEYDYRFISERRDEIMEVIKYRYAEKQKANLPIFGIKSQNLRGVTTTEKDMKKG